MQVKILSLSWPLLLTSFTLSVSWPLSVTIVDPCRSVALAQFPGSSVLYASGQPGNSGENVTIEAGPTPINLDLSGSDGANGQSAGYELQTNCSPHNRPRHNVQMRSGSQGKDGGSGGNGGDGGDLLVYYQEIAHLKNIYVNASGGQGGQGATGGSGSPGCSCNDYSWSITNCDSGTCNTETFSCTDGAHGQRGANGRSGADGQIGTARLVNQSLIGDRLLPEQTSIEDSVASFADEPIALSRNLWKSASGASALFADGSTLDDTYEEYQGRVEKEFQLVWDSQRPKREVLGNISAGLNEAGEIYVLSDDDLWVAGELTHGEKLTTYRVTGAVLESEARELALGRKEGQGQQFQLNVIDLGQVSDLVETRFHLRYQVQDGDRGSRFVTRYDAELPTELFNQSQDRFTLNLGQLPIGSEYVQAGTEVRVKLTITRAYAGKQTEQVLNWDGRM
jgi:hypothetical protein